jgi:plasmid stability protein
MARNDPQVRVRLPNDVKDWLQRSAARNLRSMNAEAVTILRDRMTAEKTTAGRA